MSEEEMNNGTPSDSSGVQGADPMTDEAGIDLDAGAPLPVESPASDAEAKTPIISSEAVEAAAATSAAKPNVEQDDFLDNVTFTNDNVHMDAQIYRKDKVPPPKDSDLVMPNLSVSDYTELVRRLGIDRLNADDNLDEFFKDKPEAFVRAAMILINITAMLDDNYLTNIASRKGSNWHQDIPNPLDKSRPLRANKPEITESGTGFSASVRAGTTTVVNIPLWASGFWVVLRSPKLEAWIELDERIGSDKINIGRETNGQVFSNMEVYAIKYIVDFILEHVYWVSLPNKSPELIRSLLVSSDIPQLVWGMCLAMYPKGYPLSQPCLANPEKCQHISRAIINLAKISWTDLSCLTDAQLRHMAKGTTEELLVDDVKEYQRQFVFKAEQSFRIGQSNTKIMLGVPSYEKHVKVGTEWIQGIVASTQKAFSSSTTDDERQLYMQRQTFSATLRQYGHWVEAVIEVDGAGNEVVISDLDGINDTLSELCIDTVVTQQFIDKVLNFIEATSVSVIALTKETCPKCHKVPEETDLKHPELIPLDVVGLFFTLRSLKVGR